MIQLKDGFYKVWLLVLLGTVLSVGFYLIIDLMLHLHNFKQGLILSTVIPIAVGYPISVLIKSYIKKIQLQKMKLEKLNFENKKLFSLISHDIRSPIATAKSLIDLLSEDQMDLQTGKQHLKTTSAKFDNLLEFLNNILDWSKKQTKNQPIAHSTFKCSDVINSTINIFEETRLKKNIELEVDDLDSTLHTDRESYSFVFRNILHNALKFTPKNGRIQVFTIDKGDKVKTVIKDSGVGISTDEIEKILDEDVWFTKNGTSKESGTGFGINACIKYLKRLNGELKIESQINYGTRMTIVLPK